MRLLFVTWDGPGTSYHENLFIPLLGAATEPGDDVELLQFHWRSQERTQRVMRMARASGMSYRGHDVGRHRSPFRVPLAVLRGARLLRRALADPAYDVLLVRSVIPGAMLALARLGHRRGGTTIIYDADGLPADERADFGGWSRRGARYALFRWLERWSIRAADVVLTRTKEAATILVERTGVDRRKFVVVVNGRTAPDPHDLDDAAVGTRRTKLGVPVNAPFLVYAGSVGPQYMLDQMCEITASVARHLPDTHLGFFTSEQNHALVLEAVARHGIEHLVVRELPPAEVGAHLAAADAGFALRLPVLSQRAVAPVKLGEYLLSGLPAIVTSELQHADSGLEQVTLAVSSTGADDQSVVPWLLEHVLPHRNAIRDAAREVGRTYFSIERGAETYREALELASGDRPSASRNGPSQRS